MNLFLISPFFTECTTSLNSVVSEAFIRFFLETIGHYSLFLTQGERGERIFQREAFRKSVASKSIRRFLGVFMESQMFAGFIQDKEMRKYRAKGKSCLIDLRKWLLIKHDCLLASGHYKCNLKPTPSIIVHYLCGSF